MTTASTYAVIVDGDDNTIYGPAPWSGFSFGRKIGELLAALPEPPLAGVPLDGLSTLTGLQSWPGCPFRVLPCAIVGDYDPDTQALGAPVVEGDSATVAAVDKPLEAVRAWAVARIDREAEAARMRFLTAGSGQALEYERTRAEAALAATLPDEQLTAAAFPWLEAERVAMASAGVAVTLRDVEQAVNAQSGDWNAVGSSIKALRRGAKLRVDAATEVAQIRAIFPIAWPE